MANPLDYDKHGHCIMCSKNMVVEIAVNGKVEKRFTPDYQEMEVLLSNNSKMRICTCDQCKAKLRPEDYPVIMQKVYNGWSKEVDGLNWSNERKEKHLESYKDLEIVTNAEGVAKDVLEKNIESFKSERAKEALKLAKGVVYGVGHKA